MAKKNISKPAGNESVQVSDDSWVASQVLRTLASLLLIIHLFCIAVALSAVFRPSALQTRLLDVLSPYTQLLNFDITYVPFYLTHALIEDVDHRIEVLPAGQDAADPANWHVLPERGWRGGDRYQRHQRLAAVMAFYAEQDQFVGRIAQAVAAHYLNQHGVQPAQIRARRHLLQGREDVNSLGVERDPWAPTYFRVPYAANVIVSRSGRVDIVKIDEAGQVARPETDQP